jgi:site-specific DNA-cytosine methylase
MAETRCGAGISQRLPLAGNQGDKVKQIGNAVPLDVAKALVLAPLGAA